MTEPTRDRRIKVKVLVTLLVDPAVFSAEDIVTGLTTGIEAPVLSQWEAPELQAVDVFVDDTVWEDGTPIIEPLEGWVQ